MAVAELATSTTDAFVVGGEWISEHYFSTDAKSESFLARVLARRTQWDRTEAPTSRTRFLAARADLQAAYAHVADLSDAVRQAHLANARDTESPAQLRQALRDLYQSLLGVLGYTGAGLAIDRSDDSLLRVGTPGVAGAPLAILLCHEAETPEQALARNADGREAETLLRAVQLEQGVPIFSAARLLSQLFVGDGSGTQFALVLAGRWAIVTDRDRWPEGRYLAVDLQLVAERNESRRGGGIDRALTCLDAQSLAPDAEGAIWWADTLRESVRHTVGVSQDLREGVRRSIEILANEVVARRRAKDLPPLPDAQAQPLAKQCLRFLYRILFLLYAEAKPELGVLPVGAPEYAQGYGIDRLRDLILVPLTSQRERAGTHIYDSLRVLFRLVDQGHAPRQDAGPQSNGGLEFQNLRADLFRPRATELIDQVGLGNAALQDVLARLLLSREQRGRDRGFVSYAELGINQLGAVYEGLMSYTGFFASEDLLEVAHNGNPSKGSWVVPVRRAQNIAERDKVMRDTESGERVPVVHKQGEFVFRLSGRERQQSASYYTPEVLTRFTVSQALAELLDQGGRRTPALDILGLTVCEPALGSGAFAIEATRQLAEQYLKRRQDELGQRIDPERYPIELQKTKAYIALHNVYGVDLNATAVELAEISLWLDTMVRGLHAPWFGLHLRRGNSLIGARHAVFSPAQVRDKSWLKAPPPRAIPLRSVQEDAERDAVGSELDGGVHHFLLPAAGWGSAADAKEAKQLAPEARDALRAWRRQVTKRPTKRQVEALQDLARRVERLWQFALRRLQIAESQIRRNVAVWGAGDLPDGGAVTREQVEAALADPAGAYQRLRRVMDAWCALWFWPLTDPVRTVHTCGVDRLVDPPSLDQWISGLRALLGVDRGRRGDPNAPRLTSEITWDSLNDAERMDLGMASAEQVETALRDHPWLVVCQRIAEQQGFLHWQLDFAPVFAGGGFDLQVGNPPWVRPDVQEELLLAESDPWWQLANKPTQREKSTMRGETLKIPGVRDLVLDGATDMIATAAFMRSTQEYPVLEGLRPDTYRCFMERTWSHESPRGAIGLVHPETHFTDQKAGLLRAATYRRLRRHWQFVNELLLFEVDDHVRYGVHVYGSEQAVDFKQAVSLYHPITVEKSLRHSGEGPEPGIKTPDDHWDLRAHAGRITHVTERTLRTWRDVLEDASVPVEQTRMVYAVNTDVGDVLEKLADAPRLGSLDLQFSRGWNETIDRRNGRFELEWGEPRSWGDVILQGPHLHVANPFFKRPNRSMRNNEDWSRVDLEHLAPDAIPVTAYKPAGSRVAYDREYTHWPNPAGQGADVSARDYYRIAWRNMAANTGERTLIPTLIPPGATHVHAVSSMVLNSGERELVLQSSVLSSLLTDFFVRVVPTAHIPASVVAKLPIVENSMFDAPLMVRSLRLQCLTSAYADLWQRAWSREFVRDSWTGGIEYPGRPVLGNVSRAWTPDVPLRRAADRRQALVEIDALVALSLGLTADELCTVYRTQFPVLYKYDHTSYLYDRQGRLVPREVAQAYAKRGEGATRADLTATNPSGYAYTYRPPFVHLDREADMRRAYAAFSARLRGRR